MINGTKDKVVFLMSGDALHRAVVDAFEMAASTMLKAHGLESVALSSVTTRTNVNAAFPKIVRECTLAGVESKFDEAYVEAALAAYLLVGEGLTQADYYRLTLARAGTNHEFRHTFSVRFKRGLGPLLVNLHITRALVLPYGFGWPWTYVRSGPSTRQVDLGEEAAYPELIRLLRSLETQTEVQRDSVFENMTQKQRERLSHFGTKLLLATGWLVPTDANYPDLIALKNAHEVVGLTNAQAPQFKLLVSLLERRYGGGTSVTTTGWAAALVDARPLIVAKALAESIEGLRDSEMRDQELLAELADFRSIDVAPDTLAALSGLPGTAANPAVLSKAWRSLEATYLRKLRRETYKPVRLALGYFNLYMFVYLPHWYQQHPDCRFAFPSTPNDLIAGVFVSDLGLAANHEKPISFVDFMNDQAIRRGWIPDYVYALLRQTEGFFNFIERYRSDLPDCSRFTQPLGRHDYPSVSSQAGTNKRPIPRRIFGFVVAYVETMVTCVHDLTVRIVDGQVSEDQLRGLTRGMTIHASLIAPLLGYTPTVHHRGKAVVLQWMPNVFSLQRVKLKSGQSVLLPFPHAVNQLFVNLHTGIRSNHIQWLDARTFDRLVKEDELDVSEFTRLWVNTDKRKPKGWGAFVFRAVIEVLRKQRRWRDLIAYPGFDRLVPYNNNPRSRWGSFQPLFSYFPDGRPHADSKYSVCWAELLHGAAAALQLSGETKIPRLTTLLPRAVSLDSPNRLQLLADAGEAEHKLCSLVPKSDITPHSARVSVVSHYMTFLPPEVIGRELTGQTKETVGYYFSLDEEELDADQMRQAMTVRDRAYSDDFDSLVDLNHGSRSRFVHADRPHSNFAKSLRSDFEGTVLSYGCISLTLNEDAKSGLDILRETRAENAAENKTEICPYGNMCPREIVLMLRGFRRCSLCPYAVRHVDHLPAIAVRRKHVLEMLSELDSKQSALHNGVSEYSDDDLDRLEEERQQLAEDCAGWLVAEETLDHIRLEMISNAKETGWTVPCPEVIQRDLRRVAAPSNLTQYVLARLSECVAYPMYESPQIRARIDLLRRQILMNVGRVKEAFDLEVPASPAAECLGLIRAVCKANDFSYNDILLILSDNHHMAVDWHGPKLLGFGDQGNDQA